MAKCVEIRQRRLSFPDDNRGSFGRISSIWTGRVEAYFCLDFFGSFYIKAKTNIS